MSFRSRFFFFLERVCQGVRALVPAEGGPLTVEWALPWESGHVGRSC